MKLKQSKTVALLIILLIAFLLIPLILNLSGMNEGFKDFDTFSDYNTIDRIDQTDLSGTKFAYCIGGQVKCNGGVGNLRELSTSAFSSTNRYPGGKTYYSTCDNSANVICDSNLFSEVSSSNYATYTLSNTGSNFPLNKTNKGFTTAYSYTPAIMDGDNIDILDGPNQGILSTLNKCSFVGSKFITPCMDAITKSTGTTLKSKPGSTVTFNSYDVSGVRYTSSNYVKDVDVAATPNGIIQNGSMQNGSTGSSTAPTPVDTDNKCSNIPCIADFGTNVGDNLCCGQPGVLQNTKYACPATAPKCGNFKCGSKFGSCSV